MDVKEGRRLKAVLLGPRVRGAYIETALVQREGREPDIYHLTPQEVQTSSKRRPLDGTLVYRSTPSQGWWTFHETEPAD